MPLPDCARNPDSTYFMTVGKQTSSHFNRLGNVVAPRNQSSTMKDSHLPAGQQSDPGAQRKRKATRPVTISAGASRGCYKPQLPASFEMPSAASFDSSTSSTTDQYCMPGSYGSSNLLARVSASSTLSMEMEEGTNDGSGPSNGCTLLCNDEMLAEDDPHDNAYLEDPCSTSYARSFASSCSSASAHDAFAVETTPREDSPMHWDYWEVGDYPEDPPQAHDLERYELPVVPPSSLTHSLATVYGFSANCIALGTAYLQRLAARSPFLLHTGLSLPDFAPFFQGVMHDESQQPTFIGHPVHSQSPKIYVMALHLSCIYLAAKSVEMVPYKHLLQTMLTHIHKQTVTRDLAEALEMEIIQGLDWRLSPYFLTPRPQSSPAAIIA